MHSKETQTATEAGVPKSDASIVLGGAGNGLMLASIPWVAAEMYNDVIKNKPLSRPIKIGGVFVAVAGCALGAAYGIKEAKELNHYRQSLREELADLRDKTEQNAQKIDAWTEKEKARHVHREHHSVER